MSKDLKKANREMKNAEYKRNLGDCYCYGTGVKQNSRTAYECYIKAMVMGSVEAIKNIGDCYWCGTAVEQNHDKAYEHFKKASELGSIEASEILLKFSKEQVEKFETALEIENLKQIVAKLLNRVDELETAILYAPPNVPNGGMGFQKAKENFESLASKMQNLDDETGPLD
jgi:TPR repeat protein